MGVILRERERGIERYRAECTGKQRGIHTETELSEKSKHRRMERHDDGNRGASTEQRRDVQYRVNTDVEQQTHKPTEAVHACLIWVPL